MEKYIIVELEKPFSNERLEKKFYNGLRDMYCTYKFITIPDRPKFLIREATECEEKLIIELEKYRQ